MRDLLRRLLSHSFLSHFFNGRAAAPLGGQRILILTPIKDAAGCAGTYFQNLSRLSYPHQLISVGLLESDSADNTFALFRDRLSWLRSEFRRVRIWKRDFGYHIPAGLPRWEPAIQGARRAILARSRNHLLFHALDDEDWVLWIDADVIEYPAGLIELLLTTGKDIVQPHCVLRYGGPTFDRNGWRDRGRLHLDDLRDAGDLVPLDTVGGTVLLVRADLHRDGLIFPAYHYGHESSLIRGRQGEIETEGFGIMAHDMGYECWGMPRLEVLHRNA